MIAEINENIKYFLALNLEPDIFWSILPLVIATIVIIAYFTRYEDEKAGWNTYLSNSLVLLFVSINLFKYIYNLNGLGAANYLEHPNKGIAIILLVTIGVIVTRFNFSHLLPERYAKTISSPLSVNLLAYAAILYVYSSKVSGLYMFLSLAIILIVLGLIFEGLKFPLRKTFAIIEKEKERERLRDIKESRLEIDELKRELRNREKELKQIELRKIERERKSAIRLERALKKR